MPNPNCDFFNLTLVERVMRESIKGYERQYDLPWNDKKVAVLKALLTLGATETNGYWAYTRRIAKAASTSELPISDKDVRHYCYHARAGKLVELDPHGSEFKFQLTTLGEQTMTFDPTKGGGTGGMDPDTMNKMIDKRANEIAYDRLEEQRRNHQEATEKLKDMVEDYQRQMEEANKRADANIKLFTEVRLKDANGKTVKTTKGLFHAKFRKILDLAEMRKSILLYGPTGSGKSYICSQLAESLKLPYRFVSCTAGMSEGVIAGRLLPLGERGRFEYVISEFVKSYEEGGVFLLDELDASDPNVLLIINAALANSQMAVTNRPSKPYAKRHKDFVCVAAANTVGTGADRMYSGRNKLDLSTLERFAIGKVFIDYDHRVEEVLCPDQELRIRCWKIRKAINDHRLERAMSTRFMEYAYETKRDKGWTFADIDEAFFAGWREDEMNKVKSML